jgi:hypothetical protein
MGSSRSCDDEDGIDDRRVLLRLLLLQGIVIMLLFILCGSCLRWADRRGALLSSWWRRRTCWESVLREPTDFSKSKTTQQPGGCM